LQLSLVSPKIPESSEILITLALRRSTGRYSSGQTIDINGGMDF